MLHAIACLDEIHRWNPYFVLDNQKVPKAGVYVQEKNQNHYVVDEVEI
jgi:hypothetical protein